MTSACFDYLLILIEADIKKQRTHYREPISPRSKRASRVVENAFGILAQKWSIFYRPIETKVENTIILVRAACTLHNYCIKMNSDKDFYEKLQSQKGNINAFSGNNTDSRRSTQLAFDIRQQFVDYFNESL